MSLVGAVYGALLVNAGKTLFSESFPDLWLFLMAGLFIGVTMAFPMGLAGLWDEKIKPWWKDRRKALREAAVQPPAPMMMTPPPAPVSLAPPPSPDMPLPEGVGSQRA
jgi:urea transport system permease protein